MSRITLRDIAVHAEVSVRTVSNVVNDFPHVASDTRQRVQAAIAELGYRPNIAARQLRQGRQPMISLVLPEIDSPYFSELAAWLVRGAELRGWIVHIEQTDGDLMRERAMLRGAHGLGADAIVFSPWAVGADEIERGPSAPPVIMLGERPGGGLVDHVAVDNIAAAREATEHLLAGGRRRIGAIGLQPHLSNETARLRTEGYRQALRAAGLMPRAALEIAVKRLHRPDGARAVVQLLRQEPELDAVFCYTDQLALGALHALAAGGRAVPGDVAVVGFDDIEAGRYSVPSLSTIAPDKPRLVELALDCLAERLADHTLAARERRVPHRLEIRQSSSP
ncbi:LacI family DNA-binding transcriptional regulator [Salinisphaera sp.]|uniref:LacI family DNA-binding transcriptional regulator n=1 Tax=Salinisphaera sp. TaxID=1914330 RepID=UPI002D786CA2|nr:LacI family DNA-binding transcriptional regulator [Salinisphaera sp.]HET7313064.1 LacI family DNA-binding transcriptional regulator [Salinisphaera sp.]